jgi:hypothetical protein
MTRILHTTNINEIRTIKIACAKCGLAVDLPVAGFLTPLEGCAACGVKFPVNSVRGVLDAVRALQHTMQGDAYVNAVVSIETEQV